MLLDTAKTLVTTRDILFTRYTIKCVAIPVCWETGNSFIHSFLNLDLNTFVPSKFFFAFSAGGTTQCLPLSDAIVFVQDLRKIDRYITHLRDCSSLLLSLLSKGNHSIKIERRKKLFSLIDLSKGRDLMRNVFHEICSW